MVCTQLRGLGGHWARARLSPARSGDEQDFHAQSAGCGVDQGRGPRESNVRKCRRVQGWPFSYRGERQDSDSEKQPPLLLCLLLFFPCIDVLL